MKTAVDLTKAKFLAKKPQFVLLDSSAKTKSFFAAQLVSFSQKTDVWNKPNPLMRADLIIIAEPKINLDILAARAFSASHEAGCIWTENPSSMLSSALETAGFKALTEQLFQKHSMATPEEYGESYIERWGDTDFLANAKLAADQILEHTPKSMKLKTMKVIDVGCLNGYIMESVRRSGVENIFGTDISYFLAVEKNLNPSLLPGITVSDFSKNDYPNASFDMTICMEVLEHIPPSMTRTFIRELARITKQEGILLISTSQDWFVDETHINCRNRAEWYSEFAKHGLVAEGTQVIFPGFNSFVVRHAHGISENISNRIKTGFKLLTTGRLKRPEGR